jgi:hypothetical protein
MNMWDPATFILLMKCPHRYFKNTIHINAALEDS